MADSQQLGTLMVTIVGGEKKGDSQAISSEEEYYLNIVFPDKLCKAPPKMASKRTKPDSFRNGWTLTAPLKLSAKISESDKFTVQLLEYHYITDKKICEAQVELKSLFTGNSVCSMTAVFTDPNGTAIAAASFSLSWEHDCPPNYLLETISAGAGGGDAAAGAASFGSGLGSGEHLVRQNLNNPKIEHAVDLPDCEGRDFNIRMRIHKARNLQSTEEDQLYDPLVVVAVGGQKQSSEYQRSTNNPSWDEEIYFQCSKVDPQFWSTPIVFTVMDHHIAIPNRKIGECQMDCASVYRSSANHFLQQKWLILRKGKDSEQVMGFLKLSVAVLDAQRDAVPEIEEEGDDDESEESIVMNLVPSPGALFDRIYLNCDLIKAEHLPDMDSVGPLFGLADATGKRCDPYVKLKYGTKSLKTVTQPNTQTPEWNTSLSLPVLLPTLTETLFIQMYDEDVTTDEIIATCPVSFTTMMNNGSAGLPSLPATWMNFYGSPRGSHPSVRINSYLEKMDRGVVPGIDYRGRLLMRIDGLREPCPPNVKPRPITQLTVSVTAIVQALQFSMLPKGKYKLRVSLGLANAESRSNPGVPMQGQDTGLSAAWFGEEMKVSGSFSVVAPNDPNTPELNKLIAQQVPDVIVHLLVGDDIYAATRFPIQSLMGKADGQYYCRNMSVLVDPNKTGEGEQPTEPLGQFVCGAFATKIEPSLEKLACRNAIRMPGIDPSGQNRFLLECCVYQARQLPAGDRNGLSDPFVRVSWANGVGQTGIKKETLNPIYNELVRCVADAKDPFPDIVVEVWDWDFFGSNTFLCKTIIPTDFAINPDKAAKITWFGNVTDSKGKVVEGCELLLSLEVKMLTETLMKATPAKGQFLSKVGSTDTYSGYVIPPAKALPMTTYKITVGIMSLRRMRRFRFMDIKAPHVEVEIAGHVVIVEKMYGANPNYNKEFELIIDLPENPLFLPQLNMRVYDNRIGTKSLVGSAVLTLDAQKYDAAHKKQEIQNVDEQISKRMQKIQEMKGLRTRGASLHVATRAKANIAKMKATAKVVMAEKAAEAKAGSLDAAEDTPLLELPQETTAGDYDDFDSTVTIFRKPKAQAEKTPEERTAAEAFDDFAKSVNQTFISEEEKQARAEDHTTEADELLWFNRFDPEGFSVSAQKTVTRLGKINGVTPKGRNTLEDFFGPFNDGYLKCSLFRGWGKNKTKAGDILFELTLEKLGHAGDKLERTVKPPLRSLASRQPVKYVMRAYVISCSHLAAKDSGLLGNKSDPYLVFRLTNDSTNDDVQTVSCKDQKKFQTLNPEYFLMTEMEGSLPTHSILRVSVFDYDAIGFDELIGCTDINLEERWYSNRGYRSKASQLLAPGSLTEKRLLRNDMGQVQGSIELWVDMFNIEAERVPRPIDITPPPPIEMELRVIVWNTRDVAMQETSINGEDMTDIYVRCWMDGLLHDVQNTDVHYRSLDGTGNFNWRMLFPIVWEPRTKKIMPANSATTSFSFFHIRHEQQKFDPVLKVQIFDNDLFPGTDDFIGEANLNLLHLRPVASRRSLEHFVQVFIEDAATCCGCCNCCGDGKKDEMSLEEKQKAAKKEFDHDMNQLRASWQREADLKCKALRQKKDNEGRALYTDAQIAEFHKEFYDTARRNSYVNVFEEFIPKADKNKGGALAEMPDMIETPKYWFTVRGPKGGGRVGDVQLSFQLVKSTAVKKDKKLEAGKGRSEPSALPEPHRPDSSFFWLSSPWKSAIHILWKNYKWYILTLICLGISALCLYLFFAAGIQTKAQNLFDSKHDTTEVVVRFNRTE